MRLTAWSAALIAALAMSACGGTSVQRMDAGEVKDVSGRWNDTDSRLVAEEMISDCLSRPWYAKAQSEIGKNPTVIVGTVKNQSQEHIATETFVEDLQRSLINSGKVEFVASKGERGEVREERMDQDTNSSEETRKAHGQETGADFMLSGAINQIVDSEGGKAVVFYQTNLKLLNMKTHQIAWNGQKKLKKYVTKARASW
ncbi:MAG TPA: penicillin-binding protein activator LpoB [Elusimicrobia bacterium]|nr:MAG: penicillin-binding protein activator LpoB [Elusimicrobia bacterium GWA2_66_18]HAZ09462.1 penicillin-binding protein activator LpoB [Elusimicrobiota bacterium]